MMVQEKNYQRYQGRPTLILTAKIGYISIFDNPCISQTVSGKWVIRNCFWGGSKKFQATPDFPSNILPSTCQLFSYQDKSRQNEANIFQFSGIDTVHIYLGSIWVHLDCEIEK